MSPSVAAGTSLGLEGNFSQLFSTSWHTVYLVVPTLPPIPGRKAEQVMLTELTEAKWCLQGHGGPGTDTVMVP